MISPIYYSCLIFKDCKYLDNFSFFHWICYWNVLSFYLQIIALRLKYFFMGFFFLQNRQLSLNSLFPPSLQGHLLLRGMWFLTSMKQLSCWNGAPRAIPEEEKISLTVSSVRNVGWTPASVRFVGEVSVSSPGTQVSSTPLWQCLTLCRTWTTPLK